jgi:GNAT superfamily N-acetyltransferase
VHDEVAGFFELERHADGSVEISYFGLMPSFIGRGLGKAMLSAAATEAWSLNASRVWLHTCTLDSPRRFRITKPGASCRSRLRRTWCKLETPPS